ncbi:TetR family transcriptional regulator [Blastococcus colisei]|uniref:TetR family transcriptional regulator n=1 Tax=Blastococcus colisei TaxID=1564162 RepID=A0A543PFG7_9ACTN|nr:TetR/AcrR family transcriptional regulator [Blastococcus colisei]TQN42809.1 TetR family transcriptional regulator [Blastococcus colisei]
MTASYAAGTPWPRRPPGPNRADERYAQIYETAARLFYEKGYSRTSLQDLANAVGLQKGSLYHYIDSKEDLLFGITEYAHNFFLQLLEGVDEENLSPLAKLERMLRLHAEFAAAHFHVTAAFYNDRSALSEERQERVVQTRDAYEARLRQLVRDGQAAGEVAADVDPRMAVFGVLGMINWINQWYRPEGRMSPQEIATVFATLSVRALRPVCTCTDGDGGRQAPSSAKASPAAP